MTVMMIMARGFADLGLETSQLRVLRDHYPLQLQPINATLVIGSMTLSVRCLTYMERKPLWPTR